MAKWSVSSYQRGKEDPDKGQRSKRARTLTWDGLESQSPRPQPLPLLTVWPVGTFLLALGISLSPERRYNIRLQGTDIHENALKPGGCSVKKVSLKAEKKISWRRATIKLSHFNKKHLSASSLDEWDYPNKKPASSTTVTSFYVNTRTWPSENRSGYEVSQTFLARS